jgi:Na+/H+ antiporter NhaC
MLVLPAFIITIILLAIINFYVSPPLHSTFVTSLNIADIIKTIPYIAVFTLALMGIDVLIVLIMGGFISGALGILYSKFTVLSSITFFFEGFYQQKGIVAMLLFVMLVAGLSRIVEHNGGIKFLLHKFNARTKTKAQAERSIALLVSLIDVAVARNTISILIAGPMAQKIGGRFKISNARIATLLDIFACTAHGIIPYSSQNLLAAAMAGTSSILIIPHVYYQFIMLGVAIFSIMITKRRESNKRISGASSK